MAEYVPGNDILQPLVNSWVEKYTCAKKAKEPFDKVAKHCRVFTRSAQSFWDNDDGIYRDYMSAGVQPTFKMTFAKVFEAVAQIGPMLFYQNPKRHCEPRHGVEFIPELSQPPQPDPTMPPQMQQQMMQQHQQMLQRMQQQQAQQHSLTSARSEVVEYVLNYLPDEQPGGGLYAHSRRAVTEAIITGLGTLWTELYEVPGTNRKLVRSAYDSCDNLQIDPDCQTPDLSDAYWVMREVTEPVHKVAARYGIDKEEFKAHHESTEAATEASRSDQAQRRKDGETHDTVTYYRVWSKAGVGYRHQDRTKTGHNSEGIAALDRLAGDYVYLVIVPGMKYPLNLPGSVLDDPETTDEEIKFRLRWPIEHWRENAWPVQRLCFYEQERNPWPMAPMQPAMGEIVFVNVMLSALANRIYESSKDIIGVMSEELDAVKEAMKGDGPYRILPVGENGTSRNLNEVIQVFQQRPVTFDAWRIIDEMLQAIERRTGLTDLIYGMTTTQDRSAESSAAKREQMQIRPDDMSSQVEKWQQEAAQAERLAAHEWLTGDDLRPIIGDYGAWVWNTAIKTIPIEVVLHSADMTIEPGSSRKPNKAREVSNLEQLVPVLMPFLQGYAQTTTNTQPVQWLIQRMADAIEFDTTGLELGPLMPPPPPPPPPGQMDPEQQAIQADQQIQQQEFQMDVAENQMRNQRLQQEHSVKTQQLQHEAQMKQLSAEIEAQAAQARMTETAQAAEISRQEFLQRMASLQAEAQQKALGGQAS